MSKNDRDIEAFILKQPLTMTYSDLENAVYGRFGEGCGWTRERVVGFWLAQTNIRRGQVSLFDRDPEVRRFIEDRLFRRPLSFIREECLETFGAARTPSRSALHRYSQGVRRNRT